MCFCLRTSSLLFMIALISSFPMSSCNCYCSKYSKALLDLILRFSRLLGERFMASEASAGDFLIFLVEAAGSLVAP